MSSVSEEALTLPSPTGMGEGSENPDSRILSSNSSGVKLSRLNGNFFARRVARVSGQQSEQA